MDQRWNLDQSGMGNWHELAEQNRLLWRQNRWLRRMLACSLAFVGLAWFSGGSIVEANHSNRTVVAERFVLVDESGKKRAVLGKDAVFGLTLLDESEKPHVVLYANAEAGSGLRFFADKLDGKKQVGIGQLPNGSSAIIFSDANGKGRIGIATQPDDKPTFILSDENGQPVFSQAQP